MKNTKCKCQEHGEKVCFGVPPAARKPTPWKVETGRTPEGTISITDSSDNTSVIRCSNHLGNAQANAAFIVRCVNSHRELIKGILELRDRLTMGQDASGNSEINQDEIELCNSILAKAEASSEGGNTK